MEPRSPHDPVCLCDNEIRIGGDKLARQVHDLREGDAIVDARGAVPPAGLRTGRVVSGRDGTVPSEVDT